METVTFRARLGDDGVIRIPVGLKAPSGPVKVTVTPITEEEVAAAAKELVQRMAKFAEEHHVPGSLPSDLAENHDHYLHGMPRELTVNEGVFRRQLLLVGHTQPGRRAPRIDSAVEWPSGPVCVRGCDSLRSHGCFEFPASSRPCAQILGRHAGLADCDSRAGGRRSLGPGRRPLPPPPR